MQLLNHLLPSDVDITFGWSPIGEYYSKDALTGLELREWESFKSAARRREYLATRGLLREMIRQIKLDPDMFKFKKDTLGKPYGKYDDKHYHMSIAHTRHHVLCGISLNLSIGVDLESCARKAPERLRTRIINDAEKPLLDGEPNLRIWTIKEALVKLQGKGMRTNLNECTVLSRDNDLFTAKFNDNKRAKICSFIHENSWLALAWNC